MHKVRLIALAMLAMACSEAPTTPVADISSEVAGPDQPSVVVGETIYAVTSGNQLISFTAGSSTASTSVPITGLRGQVVVGIDFRPSDLAHTGSPNNIGVLYAVATGNLVCRIQLSTGIVQRCFRLATAAGAPVVLSGTSFGVGFNPVVDRLRVHSNTDQNLRINVDNGVTIVDGPLAYTSGDPNASANPSVVGAAYTNNDTDAATGTELYGIDTGLDVLVEFGPASAAGVEPATGPNSGQLLTVGSLGVDTDVAGFDISKATEVAYASLQIHSGSAFPAGFGLFSINLDTGAATRLGGLPATAQPVVSIAVAPGSAASAAR